MNILNSILLATLVLASTTAITACARAPDPSSSAQTSAPLPIAAEATVAQPAVAQATASLPLVVVHKSASCGCCGLWIEHMRKAGFQVEVRDSDNVNPVKERVGVPLGKGSCHTAEIGGYFVEGHVPVEDIKRLLAEKPDAKGLLLPGMPAGSPGMEMPDGTTEAYTVELVARDGSTTAFAQH